MSLTPVRAHVLEAKIVSLFDPALEEELAAVSAAAAAFGPCPTTKNT